ncbi:hypothetical protein [Tsukamurella sp. USMM236]|uniref:hypothetical protein n=1 Tax=Tsukamurella sp. USMM236 TaxID=3081301 RepID=UPI0030171DFF
MSNDASQQPPSAIDPHRGQVFADHIAELLTLELDRLQSLRQRGDSIVKTNLALTTALVAIATWATRGTPNNLWFGTWCVIAVAGIAMVASLRFSIVVQAQSSKYSLTGLATLDQMIGEKWTTDHDPLLTVARRKKESIVALRAANEKRALQADRALRLEFAFVGLLLASVATEIVERAIS